VPEPCRAPAEQSRTPQAGLTWVRRMVVRRRRLAVQLKSQLPAHSPHSGCETDAHGLRTTGVACAEPFRDRASSRVRTRHAPRILFSHRQAPVGFDGACLVLRPTVGQDGRACAKSRTARGILPRACSGARGGAQSHALTDRKLGDCAAIASADPVKPKRLARTAWRLS
jgi:hypothetical protein